MPATGVRIEWLDEIDSTNDEARRRFRAGDVGPMWIGARDQSAGRGRRGRSWVALPGNLYCSGLYSLKCSPAEAAQLSFAAALAASDVCQSVLPDHRVRVKWPNDALVDGKKICGVLLESADAPGRVVQLVIGIGINIAEAPNIPDRPATSLSALGGEMDAETALEHLVDRFEFWRSVWAREGFAPIRDAWLARAHGVGQRCLAQLNEATLEGVFTDLAPDGSLVLEMIGGETRLISAGDVFFPEALG
jgi:BirA family biotin operon repressor/biotin-[acetyl-CoA-carboxylase] ligase